MGARERLPVGRVDVLVRGEERASRSAAVVARERLPVGLEGALARERIRAHRAVELGDRKRLPSTLIRECARRLSECAKMHNAERQETFQRNTFAD